MTEPARSKQQAWRHETSRKFAVAAQVRLEVSEGEAGLRRVPPGDHSDHNGPPEPLMRHNTTMAPSNNSMLCARRRLGRLPPTKLDDAQRDDASPSDQLPASLCGGGTTSTITASMQIRNAQSSLAAPGGTPR
ncbi:hypothetical protein K3495_g9564 [Podosphaera aphanis]|nr:hypothetical protein K3495_g9564 [Podosphaera aphanis]